MSECSYNLINLSSLAKWKVSRNTNVRSMFADSEYIKDASVLSDWDVFKRESMENMFKNPLGFQMVPLE